MDLIPYKIFGTDYTLLVSPAEHLEIEQHYYELEKHMQRPVKHGITVHGPHVIVTRPKDERTERAERILNLYPVARAPLPDAR